MKRNRIHIKPNGKNSKLLILGRYLDVIDILQSYPNFSNFDSIKVNYKPGYIYLIEIDTLKTKVGCSTDIHNRLTTLNAQHSSMTGKYLKYVGVFGPFVDRFVFENAVIDDMSKYFKNYEGDEWFNTEIIKAFIILENCPGRIYYLGRYSYFQEVFFNLLYECFKDKNLILTSPTLKIDTIKNLLKRKHFIDNITLKQHLFHFGQKYDWLTVDKDSIHIKKSFIKELSILETSVFLKNEQSELNYII